MIDLQIESCHHWCIDDMSTDSYRPQKETILQHMFQQPKCNGQKLIIQYSVLVVIYLNEGVVIVMLGNWI